MPLPTFLVVGAAKSATTSLYHACVDHEGIYVSPIRKEGRFFSELGLGKATWPKNYFFPTATNFEEYKDLFSSHTDQIAIGDISPDYFHYAEVSAGNISRILGTETRIVIILRNPVERAFSHYLQNVRRGAEQLSFADAIRYEDIRKKNNWSFQWLYSDASLYTERVKIFKQVFNNVLILTTESFQDSPRETLQRFYKFISVEASVEVDFPRANYGGVQSQREHLLTREIDHCEALKYTDLGIFEAEPASKQPGPDTSFDLGGLLKKIDLCSVSPRTADILRRRHERDLELLENLFGISLKAL